jgi:nucleoside-triphosphatase THEP1
MLSDGTRIPLARRGSTEGIPTAGTTRTGPFTFFTDAIHAGRAELDGARALTTALVIVDEVGPLELQGQGWTPVLLQLIVARAHPLILVVRPSLVNEICSRWNLEPLEIWDASVLDARTIWTDLRLAFTDRALYSQGRNGYLAVVAR